MTRQPDRDGRGPARTAGGAPPPEEAPEPPAIQINAPEDSPPGSAPEAPASGQPNVESMLRNIMARIDQTDRKYAHALDDLHSRLNDLASRADSARAHGPSDADAAEALRRLSGQAGSLADQMREADTRYQAPRDEDAAHGAQPHGGETARHGEASASTPETETPAGPRDAGSEDISADMADIGQYFADVTARLERSFASDTGTGDPESLSARMDDLARRFDEALATKSDLAALHSIESQLESLADSFASTREHFNRLDGIEHELRALSQRNHQVDLRTVEALEVMNTSLQSLVDSLGTGPGGGQQATAESPAPETAQVQTPPSMPERSAEVWIETEDHRDATAEFAGRTATGAGAPDAGDAAAAAGAPSAGGQPRHDETRAPETVQELADNVAANRAPEPAHAPAGDTADPPAPRYRSSEDLIASLRREASKASTQVREPDAAPAQSRKSGGDSPLAFLKRNRSAETAAEEQADARPPHSRLVAIAIFLLLVSASLFYSRLHDALVPFGDFLPQQSEPPASGADNTGDAANPDPARARQPHDADAPGVRTDKRRDGDASAQPAMPARLNPSGARTNAPSADPSAPGPGMGGSWQPLKRETVESPFPGVTMAIGEPGAPAQGGPEAGTGDDSGTSGPALVPATPTPSSAQDGPRRVSIPGQAPDTQAGSASGEPQDGALPAGIGPQSLRTAAAKGNPAAQFEVAARFAKGDGGGPDPAKAAEWYRRAAAQGFAPAQYRLAVLHERGLGVKKDPGTARTWYRRAAELGNVKAMHNLAVMHGRPGSGAPDYATARHWFLAAARHGLVDSQYNLGVLNENGLGVPPNPEDAYKWYSLAAADGDAEAGNRAERMRQKLSAAAIKRVDKAVRTWEPLKSDAKANAERFDEADWSEADAGGADKPKPVTIARVQFLLNELGYDAGDPDGLMGPKTARAIRNFEASNGSDGSGKVTTELLSRLEAAAG